MASCSLTTSIWTNSCLFNIFSSVLLFTFVFFGTIIFLLRLRKHAIGGTLEEEEPLIPQAQQSAFHNSSAVSRTLAIMVFESFAVELVIDSWNMVRRMPSVIYHDKKLITDVLNSFSWLVMTSLMFFWTSKQVTTSYRLNSLKFPKLVIGFVRVALFLELVCLYQWIMSITYPTEGS
jgi:hypothetical protein